MAKKKSFKRNAKNTTAYKLNDQKQGKVETDVPVAKITVSPTNSVGQSILLKQCRLCESKDGPFVDMFDAEMILAKKIDDIMPFAISEKDELPQKICFRCSAKVEEVYEFIQKCVKTQENFHATAGIKIVLKRSARFSYRSAWEDKLRERNISNDDICNALVQKAIEGIRNLPIKPLDDSDIDIVKTNPRRKLNSKDSAAPFVKEENKNTISSPGNYMKNESENHGNTNAAPTSIEKRLIKTNAFSLDNDTSNAIEDKVQPFNIMDHVSMIKVNGVGVLFQCKLCNRNFLVKEVVMNHRCAKNGGKKIAEEDKIVVPPPPKVPVIKYINTKPQTEIKISETKSDEYCSKIINSIPINLDDDEDDKPLVPLKPKHKIGPASKTRHLQNTLSESTATQDNISPQHYQISISDTSAPGATVEMPLSTLNANSRFKIIQGPNNSLVMVEDKLEDISEKGTVPNNNSLNKLQSITVKNIPKTTNIRQQQPSPIEQPYPVRLIKSGVADESESLSSSVTTPSKKQSYTIVHTGNPSKFLISTKSQSSEDIPMKKLKRTRRENSFSGASQDAQKQLITFVNVDSTAEPSYVLPTGNIIQESQISNSSIKPSSDKDIYPCNICGEKFSREKKLQSHIQSHYNQLDEEDQKRGYIKKRKLMS